MRTQTRRAFLMLPLTLVPVGLLAVESAACEIAVNLDSMVVDAGAPSDALDCGICADVSVDADYDAPDVSIYGIAPPAAPRDGGAAPDARDATTSASGGGG
jgi:hypothetical protein